MRSSACKMVRTLVQLIRTLDQMPEEHIILMKLLYYDDVRPEDYEPPFFRTCSGEEANNTWTKNPLKMEVGNVNSKHLVLALKVKSALDPCEDENNNLAEDKEVSLGVDSLQEHDSSSDSEIRPSFAEKFVVAPIGERNRHEDEGMISEADTEDPHHEEQTFHVKEWITSRHISTIDLTDILCNFPELSLALTKDIMENLRKEGLVSKSGRDSYTIVKEKVAKISGLNLDDHLKLNPNIDAVKDKVEMKESPRTEKTHKKVDDDYMYMKALYHALPMDYVTIAKLQSKLDGEANQTTVRKLVEKMAQDGNLKASGNKRLGKQVAHSESSNKKLEEVKKALDIKPVPIASLESGAADEEGEPPRIMICAGNDNRSAREMNSRKASTVKEPIQQHTKRQKLQAQ